MLAGLLAIVVVLGLLGGLGLVAYKAFQAGQSEPQQRVSAKKQAAAAAAAEADPDDDVAPLNAGQRRRGGAAIRARLQAEQQRRGREREEAARAAAGLPPQDAEEPSGSDDEEEGGQRQGRDARRARQEAERIAREVRMGRKEVYEEKRKKKDEEREARERAQEEEIRRAAEEKQRQEDEEAAKWMDKFELVKGGDGEAEAAEESSGLLGQFIDYIKQHKMVPLEQVANEFGLRTTDVIDRINGLEAMGRLTGVMDERGKFIYVSPEEMQKVADFVRERGRIAIAELATRSSALIDLEPKAGPAVGAACARPVLDFDAVLGEPTAA